MTLLSLLHLCDSLFPIGGFSHSDGLEAAGATSADDLQDWLDVCLDETFTHLEGPAVRDAWNAFAAGDWDALAALDREAIALRPSSSARRATRAMGFRLVTTWCALHPSSGLEHAVRVAREGTFAPSLPVAFGIACAAQTIERRDGIAGFAYTRLAATVSAAMRLMPIGQTTAHLALARTLARVPAAVDAIEHSRAPVECFAPLMDIAAMSQQYMESRLFRS